MNDAEIGQIIVEIENKFSGRRFGKVFQLEPHAFAVDFYPHNGAYLFVNIDPKIRQAYLIRRRLKELERSSIHPSLFAIHLRKLLTGREVTSLKKLPDSKVIVMALGASDEIGSAENRSLVIQLGGKQPNLYILNTEGAVIGAAREHAGQIVGEIYIPPVDHADPEASIPELNGRKLSDILDEKGRETIGGIEFESLATIARRKINSDIAKRRKLVRNLEGDLAGHGDADKWKRFGDLILANLSTLKREGDRLIVTDYYDPDMAEIEIDSAKNQTPTETAEGFFKKYTKARNGAAIIAERLKIVNAEIDSLERKKSELEAAIATGDEKGLENFLPAAKPVPIPGKRKLATDDFKGARQFVSTDGFEILVGKKAKDNDYLTFRVAKSLDLWLHAADYPGSHVIVKNPNRKEIPERTLIESAQLAAFYSDAREKPKAAVNYTQKKFVNKPKRSAPGLVSLASFKTILVEPKVAV